MRSLLTSILIAALAALVFPQSYVAGQKPFTKETLLGGGSTALGLGEQGPGSLLDPSRFSMQQSYSMSYMSDGKNSDMTGLYLNRLQYNFQAPVTLQVDVGLFHKPMALMDRNAGTAGQKSAVLTVPHAALLYQPSKNFSMAFEYFNLPGGYSNSMTPYGLFYDDPFAPPFRSAGSRDNRSSATSQNGR